MATCQQENIMKAVNEARRLLAERQNAEVRKWTDQVGDDSNAAVTGGAAGCGTFGDSPLESCGPPISESSEEEWDWQQSDSSSGTKRIISLADVVAPSALDLLQPAHQAGGDAAASGADCTSKPRKMHSLRLSELRWDALANKREQRRTLHLRGLPPKFCRAGALEVLLKAEGLWEAVANLRLLPRKAAQPGCAVLAAKDSTDVQRLAKYFHGRQFGPGAPVAVSFAAPGFVKGQRSGQDPAKVQSSLDVVGVASSPLGGTIGEAAWQLHHFELAARSPCTGALGMYPLEDLPVRGSITNNVEDSSAATTMDDLALEGSTSLRACSASTSSSGCGSEYESEGRDREVLLMPPPGLEGFGPHLAC
mmetsp:Transcript_104800/g.208251  ORF Transcript_104800/g.208251 Transcript_104800/m.208251 type:complete len:364 (+) Transcript_104800:61-1152(+)